MSLEWAMATSIMALVLVLVVGAVLLRIGKTLGELEKRIKDVEQRHL